ncbi:NACHT domain-containing protein [Streptomyces sp. NPDC020965]|uniref:NACHT domain-containing protein n=1 Tax=Streptomyces sp. NPDC020965 TaxID=3365105 RepID=UPI00378E3966
METGERRTRRALWGFGAVFALLGAASLVWAVRAWQRPGMADAGDQARVLGFAASAVGLLLSAASLVVAWLGYRAGRREHTAESASSLADALAVAVRRAWEAEARSRRLNDPYPLPVSWRAAPAALADVPEGAVDPAGRDDGIGVLLRERLPAPRLVVLGEPGAGKSMLLVRLLLDLCDQRADGDPVPVLFPLSSWDPAADELDVWMERRLRTDHPALAADHGRTSRAGALLEHRLVLPLLDGFDEMAPAARAVALDALNRSLPAPHPFVLCGRTAEYRRALHPADGVPVRLGRTTAIVLDPLDAADADAYLVRDAGGDHTPAAARWSAVRRGLGSDSPVGRVLDTPLALFLARTIYNPRPGEGTRTLPDPDELCDLVRFPTAEALRTHLFEAYVPAAYRTDPGRPCAWTPERAERYLIFLARHVRALGTADIAWWSLARGLPRGVLTLLKGVAVGVMWWCALVVTSLALWWLIATEAPPELLAAVVVGAWSAADPLMFTPMGETQRRVMANPGPDQMILLPMALPTLLLCAFAVVLLSRIHVRERPAARLRWRPDVAVAGRSVLVGALAGGCVGMGLGDLSMGATSACVALVMTAALTGWRTAPADLTGTVSPRRALVADRDALRGYVRRMVLFYGVLGAPALGTLVDLVDQLTSVDEEAAPELWGVAYAAGIGQVLGVILALAVVLHRTASAPWFLARHYHAALGHLPRDLLAFLEDAHLRGVLRQAGAVYQFRHIDLQEQLSGRPGGGRGAPVTEPPPDAEPAPARSPDRAGGPGTGR